MRNYYVPPEADESEKIIGGILDMRQFLWIGAGFAVGMVFVMLTFSKLNIFSIGIGIIIGCVGLPFAFYKKEGLTLAQVILRKIQFNKKSKELPNIIKEENL